MIEGSLEGKLPTIWTDGKAEVRREGKRREKVRRKKMQAREKVEKSRFIVFFPLVCGPGGWKSRLAKAAGAEPCGQMRDGTIARHCGEKHISKSKYTKHVSFGAFFGIEMSKKCRCL